MGGSILTDSDGVVREDIAHTKLRKGRDADRSAEVVSEDEEGRAGGGEDSVVAEAVHDGTHGVLADAVVEVAAGVGLVG